MFDYRTSRHATVTSRAVVGLAVCFSMLGSCTSRPGLGTISGHLFAVGGPPPGLPRPLPGTIYVSGSEHLQVTVGSDGTYSLVVPEGTYTVSGRSPLYQGGQLLCRAPSQVTVRDGASIKADTFCDER
jgi:hypothetical protein